MSLDLLETCVGDPMPRRLEALADLAPPAPAVACFDTAFHARIPGAACTYAPPSQWRQS